MSHAPDPKHLIPLAAMVTALRQELLDARAGGEGADLRFEVSDLELELTVATTQEQAGGVGIRFWAVAADARIKEATANTHKVRLKLTPRTPDGGRPQISQSMPRPD